MPRPFPRLAPLALALAAALAGVAAAPSIAQDRGEGDVETSTETAAPTKGEERLAKLLEGRVAGEPQRCIRTFPNMPLETINRTALVYGRGKTIYVQRTRNPDSISDNDILVANRFNASELCRLDQVSTIDRLQGFFTGAIFLEDFVPYTRVEDEGALAS